MISLRSLTRITSAAVVAVALAACSDGPANPLSRGLQAGSASFDGKVGSTGNSAKNGDIDVRVMLDKSGNAFMYIRTGTFDPATGVATPNGYFQTIQYKIYNASGKQVLVKNVNFKHTGLSTYVTWINLCSSADHDDDDGDDHDAACSCGTKFGKDWKVSIQANLKGVGGDDKKTDVVREDGVNGFFPDIDMTNQAITIVGATGQTTVLPANAPTTFTVPIPNNKPVGVTGPGSSAVNVTCLVLVDNIIQLPIPNVKIFGIWTNPNAFSYVNDPSTTIPANGTSSCQFQLTLPAGSHTIMVTAAPVLPGDFDYSNNSTQKFTYTATSAQPDVSAQGVFTIGGKLPSAVTLAAGAQVSLEQGVSLLSGAPPGIVPCTMTITKVPGGTPVVLTGFVNLATTGAAASCRVNYTFPDLGNYDVVTTATLPSGFTDTDPSNNTSAVVHLSVTTGTPSSNVTIGTITYTDPNVTTLINNVPTPISSQLGSASPAASEDSVHNQDLAAYSAPVTVAALQFAPGVDVTCSATIDGKVANATNFPGFVWTSGPTLSGLTTASNRACSFTVPFNSTDFTATNGIQHTVVFNITTSVANSAPASSQTVTGVVAEFVRVDLSVDPLEVAIGTSNTFSALTGASIPQESSVKLRAPIHNPSTFPVTVNCGSLVQNVVTPTTKDMPVANVPLPAALAAATTTQTVTVAAGGVNYCQYTATAPPALGLISIAMVALELPASGATNPQDWRFTNNPSIGTFTIISNGKFTNLPPASAGQSIVALQDWNNAPSNKSANVDTLNHQQVIVSDLALKVIPTQPVLGFFKLTTTVTSGAGTVASPTITFGTSVISGNVNQAIGGENCDDVHADLGAKLAGASPAEPLSIFGQAPLEYYASVCSSPTVGNSNQQTITVNYSQNLFQQVLGSVNPLLFRDKVEIRMALDFQLTGSPTPDKVTAVITMPVTAFWSGSCSNVGGSPPTSVNCATVFGPFSIATP